MQWTPVSFLVYLEDCSQAYCRNLDVQLQLLIKAYSAYRLSLLVFGIAIGILLWWMLTKTKVGAMIRAGVDDRHMLEASGVNVNFVFAITFMLGAGLAGFRGVS